MALDIPLVFEDADVVVIAKPVGLIVHSDGRTEEPSVAEWMLERYPETANVGEPWVSPQGEVIPRSGIVHRLDRTTSGVMILAKTTAAHAFLKEQFQSRSAKKRYLAYVYGHPKENAGTIEAEIVRVRSTPPRWGVKRAKEGRKHREAVTLWRVRERGTDQATGEQVAFLELSPQTGRTHQLRVHLKHLACPIVCDPLYAAGKPCLLGFTRPALHAFELTLALPSTGVHTFSAPLPDDFVRAGSCFKNVA